MICREVGGIVKKPTRAVSRFGGKPARLRTPTSRYINSPVVLDGKNAIISLSFFFVNIVKIAKT